MLLQTGLSTQRRLAGSSTEPAYGEGWAAAEIQFGRKVFGGISARFSPRTFSTFPDPVGATRYEAWGVGSMLGYRWRATPWLAIPADLAVTLRSTAVWDVVPWDDLPQARQYAVVATPRIGAEFYPLRWLSVDVRLGADIEVGHWTSPDGASRRVNNTGVVAGGGLGFHF